MNTSFYCKECDLSFVRKFTYDRHCQRKHRNYVCHMCSTSIGYKVDLDAHIKHCDLRYHCDQCLYSTDNKKRFYKQLLSRHQENSNILSDKVKL